MILTINAYFLLYHRNLICKQNHSIHNINVHLNLRKTKKKAKVRYF